MNPFHAIILLLASLHCINYIECAGFDSSITNTILTKTNGWRRCHGAVPLVKDEELMKGAQAWAKKLAQKGQLKHSESKGKYSENLFWCSNAYYNGTEDDKGAVLSWYKEAACYHGDSKDGHINKWGHFTALVWRCSTSMGCGSAVRSNAPMKGVFIVCWYSPIGNFQGYFESNVLEPYGDNAIFKGCNK